MSSRESWYAAHTDTVNRWTPMNSFCEISASTSSQSSIASFVLAIDLSNDFACVWQPFKDGTVATK
jgi:hypothetical protein